MAAGSSAIEAGAAFVRLFVRNAELRKGLKDSKQMLDDFASSAGTIGAGMIAAGAAVAAPLVAAVKSATEFQDVLLGIRASTGMTGEAMQRVQDAAMAMSEQLGIGPAAASQGMMELLKAGVSVDKVLGGAGKAGLEFAKIAEMDTAQAAIVMADAMNVFKVSADVAGNALSSAADASSTSVNGMAQAMSMASAVAGLANQNIIDTSAALAMLANAGVKGSDAGTSLKTMLLALMAPSEISAKAMRDVGLSTESFRDAEGKMLPLVEMIRLFNAATADMDQAAKDEATRKIFGTDAIRAAAIITGAGVDGFNKMKDAMANALPVSEKYKILMSGLSGAWEKGKAALQRLAVSVEEELRPSIDAMATGIGHAISWFTQFINNNRELVSYMAATAAGLIAGGAAFLGIALAAKVAAVAIGLISGAFAVFSMTPAILALTAGVLAFQGLDKAGVISLKNVRDTAAETLSYFADVFGPMFGTIKDAFIESWAGISSAIKAGDFKTAGKIAMAGLEVVMAAGILAFTTLWEDFVLGLHELFRGIPIALIEQLESVAFLSPALKALMALGVTDKIKSDLARKVTEAGAARTAKINTAKQTVEDAKRRLTDLTDAEAKSEEDRKQIRQAEAPSAQEPQGTYWAAESENPEMLQGTQWSAASEMPELTQGLNLWRGWLGAAAEAVRDVAQTDIPIIGMNLGEAAMAAGVPAGAMDAIAGKNWNQQFTAAQTRPLYEPALVTHSAAALSAAGFMGGGSPQERMASGIDKVVDAAQQQIALMREEAAAAQAMIASFNGLRESFVYG